jgi:two-component system cell cycle response regulator DivK
MSSPKILIVEDNALNMELAVDLLQASGFCVYCTRTAEEGIRLAREVQPELVLMDISLPGMDGLCATRALKADPASRHLTVVGLTAHAMKGDEANGRDAGFDGYLTKPINTRTFVASVKEFIAANANKT